VCPQGEEGTVMTETPARARTDVTVQPALGTEAEHAKIRRLGVGLTAGVLAWAASMFAFATINEGVQERIGDLTGLAFQLGLFCLLTVQFRTGATGLSRPAVAMLKVEAAAWPPSGRCCTGSCRRTCRTRPLSWRSTSAGRCRWSG
jgi:hypothetical protein